MSAVAALATKFAARGFVCLDRFVDGCELNDLRTDVESLLAAPVPSGCERPNNKLVPLRWNDRPVRLLLESEHRRRTLIDAIAARDLRWISGYVSVKESHSGPLWWHQDWWCWDHPISYRAEAAQVAVLCYLTDTAAKNGALRVLRGTHRRSIDVHAALAEVEATGPSEVDGNHAAIRDHPEQVTLELTAGDAVVIDYRLLHGTHGNESGERRDCLLLNFTPAWRDLPDDIRAHLIQQPGLPAVGEHANEALMPLLPSFKGVPRDLELSRVAPRGFTAMG
jgi:hypothetical protein